MNSANACSFTHVNPRSAAYLLIFFLAIPFGLALEVLQLSSDAALLTSVVAFVLFLVLPVVLVAITLRKKERVVVHDACLDSRSYKKILYEDIKTVTFSPLKPKPNVLLVMKNGKRFIWIALTSDDASIEECSQFRNKLVDALKRKYGSSPGLDAPRVDFDKGEDGTALRFLTVFGSKAHPYRFLILALYLLVTTWIYMYV